MNPKVLAREASVRHPHAALPRPTDDKGLARERCSHACVGTSYRHEKNDGAHPVVRSSLAAVVGGGSDERWTRY
jgi:hypothetical protein